MKRLLALILAVFISVFATACSEEETIEILVEDGVAVTEELIVEYGYDYYVTDEVALYLHVFWELPRTSLPKTKRTTTAGSAAREICGRLPTGFASAETASETARVFCPTPRGARGTSAM